MWSLGLTDKNWVFLTSEYECCFTYFLSFPKPSVLVVSWSSELSMTGHSRDQALVCQVSPV